MFADIGGMFLENSFALTVFVLVHGRSGLTTMMVNNMAAIDIAQSKS
ncbi:MAG: hypothetical protein WBO24_02360 [Nitrospirales bacterium]